MGKRHAIRNLALASLKSLKLKLSSLSHTPFILSDLSPPPKSDAIVHHASDFSLITNFAEGEYTLIGEAILGPLLHCFYSRLHNLLAYENSQRKVDNIFFVSREGYLLRRGYDLYVRHLGQRIGINSCYLKTSRTLLSRLILSKGQSVRLLSNTSYSGSLIDCCINRYQIPDDVLRQHISPYLNTDQELTHESLQKLSEIYSKTDYARTELTKYTQYLGSLRFASEKPAVIADIGYKGSIQDFLSYLFAVNINGYYLITSESAHTPSKLCTTSTKSGLVLQGADWESEPLLRASLVLEALLAAPHGSVIGINPNRPGFEFVYGESTYGREDYSRILRIFSSAMNYVITNINNRPDPESIAVLRYTYENLLKILPFSFGSLSPILHVEDCFSGVPVRPVRDISG